MEAPGWVGQVLTWLTAVAFSVMLLKSIVRERPRLQRMREQRPPRRLSRAYLSYVASSTATSWRRFFEVLWAAADSAANLASRVGVLVIAVVVLYFGFSLPATVPDWGWLWVLPGAIVGTGVIWAVVISRTKESADHEPDEG